MLAWAATHLYISSHPKHHFIFRIQDSWRSTWVASWRLRGRNNLDRWMRWSNKHNPRQLYLLRTMQDFTDIRAHMQPFEVFTVQRFVSILPACLLRLHGCTSEIESKIFLSLYPFPPLPYAIFGAQPQNIVVTCPRQRKKMERGRACLLAEICALLSAPSCWRI